MSATVGDAPSDTTPWKRSAASTPSTPGGAGGSLSASQNHAILITALSCACFSFVAVLVALRWFLIKRRSFRHVLVMNLIISDTVKALSYFVFPIVVFIHGPISSSSAYCQVSGFFLAFSIEASDMAILIIALHSIVYILRPNSKMGEGGLYPYRKWVYLFWLGVPLIAASLAFINEKNPYVTAGTFCYLPKRPIWYRLALSWVPRYLIIAIILSMYVWIYIYVHVKFRGFDHLAGPGASGSSASESRRKSAFSAADDLERNAGAADTGLPPLPATAPHSLRSPSWKPRSQDLTAGGTPVAPDLLQPWDRMNFITAKPLQAAAVTEKAVGDDERAPSEARGSAWSGDTRLPSTEASSENGGSSASSQAASRQPSDAVLAKTTRWDVADPEAAAALPAMGSDGMSDPLRRTRAAIRKQLRYLFIYPLVYIIMWSFPFAMAILNYDDYYVQHPIFWLNVVTAVMLSLQAGVDSIIFSWTEQGYKGHNPGSWLSATFLRGHAKRLIQCPTHAAQGTAAAPTQTTEPPSGDRNPHWWEAEGRRRKDSVWLGTSPLTDLITPVVTRNRSRSPEKPTRAMHTRTRSMDKPAPFVPTLEAIGGDAAADEELPRPSCAGPSSPRRPSMTPDSSTASVKRPRPSLQGSWLSSTPGTLSRVATDAVFEEAAEQ